MEKERFLSLASLMMMVMMITPSVSGRPVRSPGSSEFFVVRCRVQEETKVGVMLTDLSKHPVVVLSFSEMTIKKMEYVLVWDKESQVTMDRKTGVVLANSRFNRESLCPTAYAEPCIVRVRFNLLERGNPKIHPARLDIEVEDINDSEPRIDVQSTFVSENYPAHSVVASVEVDDEDAGVNGLVTCRLEQFDHNHGNWSSVNGVVEGRGVGDGWGYFTLATDAEGQVTNEAIYLVNSGKFYVVTTKVIDAELVREMYFMLHCRDNPLNESLHISMTKKVFISILDENDNSPIFTRATYRAGVPENSPPGTFVVRVEATDFDIGENSQVNYGFLDESKVTCCNLNEYTGDITLKESLDREEVATIEFEVVASDSGIPMKSGWAHVVIEVLDLNDNEPRFVRNAYIFSVKEGTPAGWQIGQVMASDPDEGYNAVIMYYSVVNRAECSFINFEPRNSTLYTASTMEADRCKSQEFVVGAKNKGSHHRVEVTVSVYVREEDEMDPAFEFPRELADDSVALQFPPVAGSEVARLRVVPRQDPVRFSILGLVHKAGDSIPDSCLKTIFLVEPESGSVFLDPECSGVPERNSHFVLRVAAVDALKSYLRVESTLRVFFTDLPVDVAANDFWKSNTFYSLLVLSWSGPILAFFCMSTHLRRLLSQVIPCRRLGRWCLASSSLPSHAASLTRPTASVPPNRSTSRSNFGNMGAADESSSPDCSSLYSSEYLPPPRAELLLETPSKTPSVTTLEQSAGGSGFLDDLGPACHRPPLHPPHFQTADRRGLATVTLPGDEGGSLKSGEGVNALTRGCSSPYLSEYPPTPKAELLLNWGPPSKTSSLTTFK